jgi:hypothetical protein
MKYPEENFERFKSRKGATKRTQDNRRNHKELRELKRGNKDEQ